MNPTLQALIFDVDGTLANTEACHLAAFNQAFAEEGLDWNWSVEQYTELLQISGGKERMLHYWKSVQPDLVDVGAGVRDTIDRLHLLKTAHYEQAVQAGKVQLRDGVLDLIHQAHQAGLKLAIATTTSPVNIAALLRKAMGEDWADYFEVIEDASTAPNKKPHPQVYQQTLQRLNLPAQHCVAFEDSQNGLQAALATHLPTIITPNNFTQHHDFTGALHIAPSLKNTRLEDIQTWWKTAQ